MLFFFFDKQKKSHANNELHEWKLIIESNRFQIFLKTNRNIRLTWNRPLNRLWGVQWIQDEKTSNEEFSTFPNRCCPFFFTFTINEAQTVTFALFRSPKPTFWKDLSSRGYYWHQIKYQEFASVRLCCGWFKRRHMQTHCSFWQCSKFNNPSWLIQYMAGWDQNNISSLSHPPEHSTWMTVGRVNKDHHGDSLMVR